MRIILNTLGDARAPESAAFAAQAQSLGMNALYAETPPKVKSKRDYLKEDGDNFHHSAGDLAFTILQQFIVNACRLRDYSGEILPPTQWPCAMSSSDPYSTIPNTKNNSAEKTQTARYFPSNEFAALWQRIPYRKLVIATPGCQWRNQWRAYSACAVSG